MSEHTVSTLSALKRAGEKIASLTVYDAGFTPLLEAAGVEVLLVGDSLGMVIQGQASTVAVSMEAMVYHTRLVARARRQALLMADMPFMSYACPELALTNAARLMREAGAQMVKLEGARLEVVAALTEQGIPVCGHLGLLPQSVHKLGGYRVQGRKADAAEALLRDALALERAGADLLVLECVPSALARRITGALEIPVIGIGAGPDCDGQVLVLYDLLGISPPPRARFVKNFLTSSDDIPAALSAYVAAVKEGDFPGPEHGYA